MKTKFAKLTLATVLGAVAMSSAFAANTVDNPLGHAVNGGADRIVKIDSSTKYLNVEQGETVQINSGGKVLTWTFDTFGTPTFALSKIFPGTDGVKVYVSGNQDDFS